jgi:hypothetical protein
MLIVLEIFFALADDLLVGPTIGTESVAVEAICTLLIILAIEGLGIQRDDRDLAPTVGAIAVGREGETAT